MPWEVLTGFVTAPSSTLTALTMGTGDTLTIRKSEKPKLLSPWADVQGASGGVLRIRSVLMHDAVQGVRLQVSTNTLRPQWPTGLFQPLQPQDVLTAELSGSAVGGQIETAVLPVHYDVLPGSEGRFVDEVALRDRAVQPEVVENTLALGTAGGYSGSEAINAEFDNYKAETDYAIVGGELAVNQAALIALRGPDTANLRVGYPGCATDAFAETTPYWFIELTRQYGLAMIPVINAANKAATNLDGAQDQAGADPTQSIIYFQMTPEAAKGAAATTQPTSRAGASPSPTPPLRGSPPAIGMPRGSIGLLGR